MATGHGHETQEKELTEEQKAQVEAIRARHRTPEARAEEARVREILDREYRETGTIKTTGDPTTMGDAVAFRRFIMSLRRERERLGLSLGDVAARRDRQGGLEPAGERPAIQPHGEYADPVCPRPRQVPGLGSDRRRYPGSEFAGLGLTAVGRSDRPFSTRFGRCVAMRLKSGPRRPPTPDRRHHPIRPAIADPRSRRIKGVPPGKQDPIRTFRRRLANPSFDDKVPGGGGGGGEGTGFLICMTSRIGLIPGKGGGK